jgi:hypothetical protein
MISLLVANFKSSAATELNTKHSACMVWHER